MLVSWKIAGLENSLWLMPTSNQNYPHSFFTNIDEYEKYGYLLYKVSYIEESDDYLIETIFIDSKWEKLSLDEYSEKRDPKNHVENPIPILCEKFDRIKALVKPLVDLLNEEYYIGPIDDAYLAKGHCFYFNDFFGWYLCRVYAIELEYFYFSCIKVEPEEGIDATVDSRSTSYDFFENYQPKYIDPEFFDYVWNLYKTTKERAINILFGKE